LIILVDSVPKYIDYAEYYDYDHVGQPMMEDVPFYIEYAKETGGPILELACGTGRVLIPIVEAGFTIHGLDISENMLCVARANIKEKKLSDLVTLSHNDMADFDLPIKNYGMAYIAARSFMHLFTQKKQLDCLECVHRHLKPGGLLLMDLYAPNFKWLSKAPEDDFEVRREFTLPNGNRVIHKRRFRGVDAVNQINSEEILFEEYDRKGNLVHTKKAYMDTRFTFRYELELLLDKVGFRVQNIFRDYKKNTFDGTGEIIVVAQK